MTRFMRAITCAGVVAVLTIGAGGAAFAASKDASTKIPGVAALTQLTPTKGGGARPFLRWKPVAGATLYQVVVLDPSGAPHWAWQGGATSVPVGGGTKPAAKGTPTATVGKGFSWTVAAFDDQHKPLALSAKRPVAP